MKSFIGMTVIGLGSGFLVGMTSVGSGSIIMMMLLLFYSYPPKVNVGTDIVHAVRLTGVTGFLHFRLGNVDPGLVAPSDRIHSRRADWFTLEHARPGALAATHLCASFF